MLIFAWIATVFQANALAMTLQEDLEGSDGVDQANICLDLNVDTVAENILEKTLLPWNLEEGITAAE